MKSIKTIENTNNKFVINYENSSLKLDSYTDEANVFVDISSFNLIKAIKVAILTSTYCFLNEFKKDICWLVSDMETKRAISILCLKNTKCQVITSQKMKATA